MSVPNGKAWWSPPTGITHMIFIVRDPFITSISARQAGHPAHWTGADAVYPDRLTKAWELMVNGAVEYGVPWLPLTYEGFIQRPIWTMKNIADWLGVPPVPLKERVADPRKDIE